MHTVWSGKTPPGRRAPTCKTLGYPGGVETRRKEAGRQIKVARRAKKFRSQRAFAEHIGVHENSVANAETGSERIGDSVFEAIERGLDWPIGSTVAYIAGAGQPPWVLSQPATSAAPGSKDPMPSQAPARVEFSAETRAKWRRMSIDEIIERGAEIGEATPGPAGLQARIRYLRAALQEKEDQLSTEDVPQ